MDRRRTTFTFYPLAMFEKSNLADFGCFLQPLTNRKGHLEMSQMAFNLSKRRETDPQLLNGVNCLLPSDLAFNIWCHSPSPTSC